jgi:hypothetical protein
MRTGIFSASFYLARPGMVIKITGKSTVGRSQGDVILEDDELLSSAHCEFGLKGIKLFVRDLNSTNGLYVNKERIPADQDHELNVGDSIKLGSHDYIVCDNLTDVRRIDRPEDRRKHPRPKNLYDLENFLNFYFAPSYFRIIYVLAILGTITSFFINLQLGIQIPAHLDFLSRFYADQIILRGLTIVFIVSAFTLLHSLALNLYFNRNLLRKISALVIYVVVILLLVDFRHGPLGGIKHYFKLRHQIENLQPQPRAIVYLKTLVKRNDELKHAYNFSRNQINPEVQKLLEADYQSLRNKLKSEIERVGEQAE